MERMVLLGIFLLKIMLLNPFHKVLYQVMKVQIDAASSVAPYYPSREHLSIKKFKNHQQTIDY
ncbi:MULTISPECIES: hypothetical protein [Alcaligenes]|uniref:hypothetical protein n=1 Tax=Alcaligenes TaxID=507 RepID=UPI0003974D12|nr:MULTISPECIES: hypothetical protein [Alcaligenes]ERI34249.1 hypothetical protein N879_01675 [Alcaligenes sp. EGD-AK7]HRO19064.1 hypothetical protein [Alcaligenes phenolicus]HRP14901.1 hypothetical protein [Alcaligenes phenolicus]